MSATVADRVRPARRARAGGRLFLAIMIGLAVVVAGGLVVWSADPRPLFKQEEVGFGLGSTNPPPLTTQGQSGGLPRARTGLVAGRDNQGQVLFGRYCDSCHTGGRSGIGPSLSTAQFKRNHPNGDKISQLVRDGGFDMPAFPPSLLSDEDLRAIVAYIMKLPQEGP